MKKYWIAILLSLLMLFLAGCQEHAKGDLLPDLPDVTAPAPAKAETTAEAVPAETSAPEVTPEAVVEDTPEPMGPEAVEFEWNTRGDGTNERLELSGKDENGVLLWKYEAESPATELSPYTDIGPREGAYYLVDKGSVVALRLDNGKEIWRNDEFKGAGASFAWDDTGKLYLCGFYGPSLFVIDESGNTVHRIADIDSRYAWENTLSWADGVLTLHFDLDMEDPDCNDTIFRIDANTFEVLEIIKK